MSDFKIGAFTDHVLVSLTGNPAFPSPSPALTDVEKAGQEYRDALAVSVRSNRTLVSSKNDKKAVLISLLSQLADYIDITSQGDRTTLFSSGFDVAGDTDELPGLQPISRFSVIVVEPGQAVSTVNRVANAKAYVHQYTTSPVTPDTEWHSETVLERSHVFMYLPSITQIWFRVIAIGRDGKKSYSPIVARVIQ